jgi:hypothetical protein
MALETWAIIISTISVIIAISTFYLTNVKGPDIKLKVNKDIKLQPALRTRIPIMFINEGGKPGTLFGGEEWYSPSVRLPNFLYDRGFKSSAYFTLGHIEFPVKLRPGDHVSGFIEIAFMENNDRLEDLTELFKQHSEIEITASYLVTTKDGIKGKTEKFKLKTELPRLEGFIS